MAQKVVLVTGATDGIGKATAIMIAKQSSYQLVIHGRSPERVAATADEIKRCCPQAKVGVLVADLSSLAEVSRMIREVNEKFSNLTILVNNAGLMMKGHSTTEDGFEMTMGVNYFAPFALTLGLLPILKRNQPSRIIHVSSVAHTRFTKKVDVADLNCERTPFHSYTQYSLSKLANVMFSQELHRRLRREESYAKVTTNSLHPGVITTKLLLSGFGMGGDPVEQGAKTSSFLALSSTVEDVSGEYYDDCRRVESNPTASDEKQCEALWKASLIATKMVGYQM